MERIDLDPLLRVRGIHRSRGAPHVRVGATTRAPHRRDRLRRHRCRPDPRPWATRGHNQPLPEPAAVRRVLRSRHAALLPRAEAATAQFLRRNRRRPHGAAVRVRSCHLGRTASLRVPHALGGWTPPGQDRCQERRLLRPLHLGVPSPTVRHPARTRRLRAMGHRRAFTADNTGPGMGIVEAHRRTHEWAAPQDSEVLAGAAAKQSGTRSAPPPRDHAAILSRNKAVGQYPSWPNVTGSHSVSFQGMSFTSEAPHLFQISLVTHPDIDPRVCVSSAVGSTLKRQAVLGRPMNRRHITSALDATQSNISGKLRASALVEPPCSPGGTSRGATCGTP
ncbi:hypothetical protein PSCLAVI8L_100162 [Pseudoclavibacter sp. 8L]|nr:hypothetical protein PSCLAVI8L_100162 [Pseudoclavibacter sp. 8L]